MLIKYLGSITILHRAQEKAKLQADPNKTLGDVTTVNLTGLNGGVQTNVVPDKYKFQMFTLVHDRNQI